MSHNIIPGDLVKHCYLENTPEMYVVETNETTAQCRYFANGMFHLHEFLLTEILHRDHVGQVRIDISDEDA